MEHVYWVIPHSLGGRPGPSVAAWDVAAMSRAGVGALVSLAGNVDSGVIQAAGIRHLYVDAQLSFEPEAQRGWLRSVIPLVTDLVRECRERARATIVHCHHGLDRTGVVLACTLIALEGENHGDAIARVRAANPEALRMDSHCNAVRQFAKIADPPSATRS